MEPSTVIEIKDLTKTYSNREEPSVDNLSIKIKAGEFYGLLGPNGAGKTTTISIISGLLDPTCGDAFIHGMNVKDHLKKIKQKIGVVSQDLALYEKLTAYENLYYFGKMQGIGSRELKERIEFLLNRLGLYKHRKEKIRTYSGGMKRRVNLLVGVLHNPDILILDEPVVGVDVHSRNVIREFLKEVNNDNTTIVYTSHIMEDAEMLCSSLSIIDYGRLVEQGSPSELIKKYSDCDSLEKVFLKLTGQKLRD